MRLLLTMKTMPSFISAFRSWASGTCAADLESEATSCEAGTFLGLKGKVRTVLLVLSCLILLVAVVCHGFTR